MPNDEKSGDVISHERAREAARRLINSHFGQQPRARISLPANLAEDDDCVIIRYIDQQAAR